MIKTYIAHCTSLVSRKKFQLLQLKQQGFDNIEFYEDYDGNRLNEDIINQYYDRNLENQYSRYSMWFPGERTRVLRNSEISLAIKHIEIYKKIANGSDPYALILEDDSVLCDNFLHKFEQYMLQVPSDFDMIFVSDGCNLKSNNIQEGKYVYRKEHPATRCTGAFVVTKKACQELLTTLIPFTLPIDWELNYQLYIHKHNVYWFEPALVKQGSEIGLFQSSVR